MKTFQLFPYKRNYQNLRLIDSMYKSQNTEPFFFLNQKQNIFIKMKKYEWRMRNPTQFSKSDKKPEEEKPNIYFFRRILDLVEL